MSGQVLIICFCRTGMPLWIWVIWFGKENRKQSRKKRVAEGRKNRHRAQSTEHRAQGTGQKEQGV